MKNWNQVKEGDTIYYWDKGKAHAQKVYEIIVEDKEWKTQIGDNEWHVATYKETTIKAGANDRSYAKHPTVINFRGYWFEKRNTINYNCMKRFSCIEALQKWLEDSYRKYDMKRQQLENKLNMVNKQIKNITDALYKK